MIARFTAGGRAGGLSARSVFRGECFSQAFHRIARYLKPVKPSF